MTLKEWLVSADMRHEDFAALIPCSRSMITLIANGTANPSWKLAMRIEEVTSGKVPKTYWFPEKAWVSE